MKKIYILLVILISFVNLYPQTIIYDSFDSGNTYNTTTGLAVLSVQFVAVKFAVDSPGYSDITLTVAAAGTVSGTLNIAIYNDDGANLPTGSSLAAGTVSVTANAHAIQSVNFPSLILNEGSYHVVMTPGTATGSWNNNTLGLTGVSTSSNSGGSWSYVSGQTTPVLRIESNNMLPVELISFTAQPAENSIKLAWNTAVEINNYGFQIERLQDSKIERLIDSEQNWETIGFISGNGNSNSIKGYTFVDENPLEGTSYYRLKQIDNDGKFEYSKIVEALFTTPEKFVLEQNYPNPFNPTTNIKFTIPENPLSGGVSEGLVSLKIYDILGNEITTLVNEVKAPGTYEVQFNASGLASGIYYYTLSAGELISTKSLIVLK